MTKTVIGVNDGVPNTKGFDYRQLTEEVQRSFNGETLADIKVQRDQCAVRLEELEATGVKLYEDRLNGVINIDTFKMLSEKVEIEKSEVMAEHGHLSCVISAEEFRIAEIHNIIPKLREFLTLEDVTRDTLAALIDHIVVSESKGRSQNRTHEVRIVYRFGA